MTAPLDLDAYCDRIGYTGERTPTLATLRAIIRRHTQTIPFENPNPLLGWPVPLDSASLQQKLVPDGRGGYCFEQNLLFSQVLESLGFEVASAAPACKPSSPCGASRPTRWWPSSFGAAAKQ